MGEIGGAVQLLRGEQTEDLVELALGSGRPEGLAVVVGLACLHASMVVGVAGGSLSIDWFGQ